MYVLRRRCVIYAVFLLSFLLPFKPLDSAEELVRRMDRAVLTYQADDARFADQVFAIVQAAAPALTEEIGIAPVDTIRIHIAGTLHEFRTYTPGAIPDWGEGYAVPDHNLIVLKSPRIDGSVANLREVVVHELAHIHLHSALRSAELPRWLSEGFAMHAAREWGFWERASLVMAVLSGNLIPLDEIRDVNTFSSRMAQLAYQESALAVQFMLVEYGPDRFRLFLRHLRMSGSIDTACFAAFGISIIQFEQAWYDFMKREYGWNAVMSELFTTLLWSGLAILFLLAYIRVRWRRRQVLKRWAREEATENSAWSREEDVWNRMKREWEIK